MSNRPHPALRVPVASSGVADGDWLTVHHAHHVPILVSEPAAYLEHYPDWSDDLHALPYPILCRLARYVPRVASGPDALTKAVIELVRDHAQAPSLAVEAGCSVGADLRALAELSDFVIGFDHSLPDVQFAQAQLTGTTVVPLERLEGRSFRTGDAYTGPAITNALVAVGDALDPPIQAGSAELVVALNLLDSIHDPVALLGQLDAITAPGGIMIIASPFAWQDSITPPDRQLGTAAHLHGYAWANDDTTPDLSTSGSAAALHAILRGDTPLLPLRHTIVETREVQWVLRDHLRAMSHYTVHICVSRKAL